MAKKILKSEYKFSCNRIQLITNKFTPWTNVFYIRLTNKNKTILTYTYVYTKYVYTLEQNGVDIHSYIHPSKKLNKYHSSKLTGHTYLINDLINT